MRILDRINSKVSQVAAVIAATLTLLLAVSITSDAVARFVTHRSLPGMVELSETLLVALVFLALGYCAHEGAHISLTLVTDAIPGRAAAWVRAAAFTFVIVFLVWMLWATSVRAFDSFLTGEYKFGLAEWPLWPARTAIVVGLFITIPVYVVSVWENVQIGTGKRPVPPKTTEDAMRVAA